MATMSNLLPAAELASWPWLQGVEVFPELGSTNDRALRLAADPTLPTPFLVVTERQTAGRGRGTNRWWSTEGALTFSLVVDMAPSVTVEFRSQLALVAGLGVRRGVSLLCGQPATVKWPNDVYLGERKLAGILIETTAARPGRAVVGIGVNVNNSLQQAPDDVQRRAVSLIDVTGERCPLTAALRTVLEQFAAELHSWELAPDQLPARWAPHCFLSGRTVQLAIGGGRTVGRCLGIATNGALRLATGEGERTCLSGVVESFDAAAGAGH
ncbi:MAG: biotin--[acetyl-CoA-carboxylase] ligase [Pirellulales bacterium]